jgi:hypothetical protein
LEAYAEKVPSGMVCIRDPPVLKTNGYEGEVNRNGEEISTSPEEILESAVSPL